MKRIVFAVSLAWVLALAGGVAAAQSDGGRWQGQQGPQGGPHGDGRGGHGPRDGHGDQGRGPGPRPQDWGRNGWRGGQPHGWARGENYHSYYRGPTYVVADYGRYHLRRPPQGYHWIRDNSGNYLMVAIATGVIADLLLH